MSEDETLGSFKLQGSDPNRSDNNCSDSNRSEGNCNESNKAQSAPLNRRRFLELTTLGIGGLGLLHSNSSLAASSLITTTNDNTNSIDSIKNLSQCKSPSIPTRIFASSNTGVDDSRNILGLQRLTCAGFDVQNPEISRRQYLRFGGTDQQRASDLQNMATGAIAVPKLLLAARGGYGAMRILESVDWKSLGRVMKDQGSILAGFSDITALQCALLAQGNMSSLAAPMLYTEFGKREPDIVSCQGFVEALTNPNLKVNLPQQNVALATPLSGILWGGNLSVVSALAGSAYLPSPEGGIVFLEEVGEQPYQVERMFYSLYLSGAFKNQQAIVLGAFSGAGEDSYDARYNLSAVIEHLSQVTGLPIYTGFPFGHVARKQSFPLGAMCHLTPTASGITLEFEGYPIIDRELIYPEGLWS
ncbi:LD-carboxypeptidase [Psychrobacter phenylpyruvicus]|uniref:Murein tetrapeptide carboxypeptidase n=1 Tax=Psychrobacter phenylpyruvicus TaxID=29432 RepID=A0A379LHY3_9GAMM|nr:LD-carboxypeptidase [Psychrobacter phenylpyruvicus]SUD90176.1 Murein tetrapeptide carboxypeptidase [Psychrobacter phenylpyruvicus]